MNHLELENYFLEKLKVEFEFPEKGEMNLHRIRSGFDYELFKHPDEELRRLMRLEVFFKGVTKKDEPIGHQIECVINGEFLIPEEMDVDKREGLLRVNGLSILYSTLRGVLGNLTGSFPGDKLCLPTIMPNELVKEIEERKAAERA